MKKSIFIIAFTLITAFGVNLGCSSSTSFNNSEVDNANVLFFMPSGQTENPFAFLHLFSPESDDACIINHLDYTENRVGNTITVQLTGEQIPFDLCAPRPGPWPAQSLSLRLTNLENDRYTIRIRNGNLNNIISIIRVGSNNIYTVNSYNFVNITWGEVASH